MLDITLEIYSNSQYPFSLLWFICCLYFWWVYKISEGVCHMAVNSQNGPTIHFSHEISWMHGKLWNFPMKLLSACNFGTNYLMTLLLSEHVIIFINHCMIFTHGHQLQPVTVIINMVWKLWIPTIYLKTSMQLYHHGPNICYWYLSEMWHHALLSMNLYFRSWYYMDFLVVIYHLLLSILL